jgi:RNA polymerase-binding protein DksA
MAKKVKKINNKKLVKKPVKAVKKAVKAAKKAPLKSKAKVLPLKPAPMMKKIENTPIKNNPIDDKPLSKAELNEYKNKLLALKEEIFNQIKEISEDTLHKSQTDATGENSAYTLDAASDNYDREFNFRLVSSDRELLLEIDAALKKIESGDYGVCVMCDKNIGRTRLSVIPYVTHCRQCKEQLEQEGKI